VLLAALKRAGTQTRTRAQPLAFMRSRAIPAGHKPTGRLLQSPARSTPTARPRSCALRGGCRTKPRRGRWIVSKGGFQNRPSHPSREARPSRGRHTQRLWRSSPRSHSSSSETALCDTLRERQECTALRRRVCDERPRERPREEREESGSGKETCYLMQAPMVVGQPCNRHDLPPAAGETRRCD
jgi:hypothetical protein